MSGIDARPPAEANPAGADPAAALREAMADLARRIEAELDRLLPREDGLEERLHAAMRHAPILSSLVSRGTCDGSACACAEISLRSSFTGMPLPEPWIAACC